MVRFFRPGTRGDTVRRDHLHGVRSLGCGFWSAIHTKTLWIGFTAKDDVTGGVVGRSVCLSRPCLFIRNHLNILSWVS